MSIKSRTAKATNDHFLRFFLLSLLAIGYLFPAQSALAKKIMVIAAHPDDEALMAAGIIRQAVLNGDQVNVVVMLNGDANGVNTGLARQLESVNAMGVLGVNENNVIFLGYGDGTLSPMFRSPPTFTPSGIGVSATYGNRGLGRADYHFYRFGSHGTYNGNTVLQDLKTLLQDFAPDEIYTHHFYDAHSDHAYANQFVVRAILDLRKQGSSYAPILYENIVHDQLTATCTANWPEAGQTFTQPACLYSTPPVPPYRWSEITSFNVPADMQDTSSALNLKRLAFNQYVSQPVPWSAYVKQNEWFWRRDIGNNIAPLAQVTVSSEAFNQFGIAAVDGNISGDPKDPLKEWRASSPNNGEWIQLTWALPQTVSRVTLYDRPGLSDNILSGTLSFSDGSTIAVGALPTNGYGQTFSFTPKQVTWVRLTVNSKAGYYTGLAEFEVYGTATQAPPNRAPQIASGPTANPATITTSQTSQLSVVASDPDADPLTYTWTTTGGSITGTGASVTFLPPAAASQATYTATITVADSRGGSTQGSVNITVSPTTLSSNIASSATVQVSSENVNTGQLGIKAIDGVADGYPNNSTKEWATVGQLAGAWIQLNWATPQNLAKVVLYDRPNSADNILAGTLSFSDGSTVTVGALPSTGAALTVLFTERVVTWVRFTVNSAVGNNIGLAEFEAYGTTPAVLPVVTIAATDNSATEGSITDTGVFTISRTGSTSPALTVNYTVSGSATNGVDYQTLPGSVVIPSGQSSVTVAVTTIEDSATEGNETVIMTLAPNASYSVGSPNTATVTILDNDLVPTISVTGGTFSYDGNPHGASGFAYGTGGVSDVLSPAVTITYQGSGGTSYGPSTSAPTSVGTYTAVASFPGNASYLPGSNSAAVTIADTTAPDTIIQSGPSATITVNNAIFTWTGTDNVSVAANLQYASRLSPTESAFSAYATATSRSLSNLANGTYTFCVQAKDQAGNVDASPACQSFTVNVLLPPTLSMSFDGQIVDRVGTAELSLVPDTKPDGVFTVTLGTSSGNRTVTQLSLTNSSGGVWDTVAPNTFWSLGVADTLTGTLRNSLTNDSVNFAIAGGGTFKIFAADFQNAMYNPGGVFTLTASFADGTTSIATATIPLPTVTVTASSPNAAEGGAPGQFTFSRVGGGLAAPLTVNYSLGGSASNGNDYQSLPGSVTFPAGAASVQIAVVPIDDTQVEGAETVVLTLTASASYVLGSANIATVTIQDNDTPTGPSLTASPTSAAPGAVETVSWSGLTNPTGLDWIGMYSAGASDGSYLGWLYVACNQSGGIAKSFGSCAMSLPNSAGTYEFRLFANNGFSRITTSNQVVAAALPTVSFSVASASIAENSSGVASLTLTRTGNTSSAMTVNYTVSGTATAGTDYVALTGSVTIAAGATTASIDVRPIDDATAEPNETVILTLSAVAGVYAVGSPASGTVTILDDEPTVSISATDATASEGTPVTDSGTFTVSRSVVSSSPLTVNYTIGGTATNTSDYQTIGGSVTIPANQSSATIAIIPVDDTLVEGNETVVLSLTANPNYSIGTPGTATITIQDNDVPAGPSLVATPISGVAGVVETVSWSGIANPTAKDWIGVYPVGAGDGSYSNWVYVSCTRGAVTARASGSCSISLPSVGTYEFRLFSNDGFSRIATSNSVAVN